MQEANFYTKLENNKVLCELCPWNCVLGIGQTGICRVRINENGRLATLVYNKVSAIGIDAIEKKPLYHFYPGSRILSIGEVGCNLYCNFCQNHTISQCSAAGFEGFINTTSKNIVEQALNTFGNIGIAYTYNEPVTFYEFMLETAKLAHKNRLKNVVVSNGYINRKPLRELLPFIDAFNIDLKAFSNEFYKKQTGTELEPVLNSLKTIAESGTHLEITTLVIPHLNDDGKTFKKMVRWISRELGSEIPLHLSRYFPQYKLQTAPTPTKKLELLYGLARQHLRYVYLGNVNDIIRSSTYCSTCGAVLIKRDNYQTKQVGLDENARCENCNSGNNIRI